jgi:mRNA-degrading endonuclease toxin of MazEF toxin-antitoxin module
VRQWEIYLFPFQAEAPHPAVVLSDDEQCLNRDIKSVNVLICTSAKLNRGPKLHEVILNGEDGLDWKTAVRCNVIYLVPKANFREKRGTVSPARRRAIARKISEMFRLQF